MLETRLVFKAEYRLDLKPVESIVIPYLFENDSSLIISLQANPSKNYKSSGRLDQVLIDYPDQLIASSQILRFGTELFEFPQKGRFKLKFYPNYYLGRTQVAIQQIMNQQNRYLRALIPTYVKYELPAGVVVKIANTNASRSEIIIRTINDPVDIATGFNTNNEPIILLDEVKSNQRYNMTETISGIYQGEIWARSIRQTSVKVTEYSTQYLTG